MQQAQEQVFWMSDFGKEAHI